MSATKQQITRIAAYGLIIDTAGILLCRLSDQVSSHQGHWTLPGGGLDFAEHPEQAMVREVREETGLSVQPLALLGIDSMVVCRESEDFQALRIIYDAEVLEGDLRFELDGTTDMCQWHSLASLGVLPIVPMVKTALSLRDIQI